MHDVHDPIARLIREAGPRRDVSPERADRVRSLVQASWTAEIEARKRRRRRRQWFLAAAFLVSAGLAAVLVSSVGKPTVSAAYGRVEVVVGGVLVDGETPSVGEKVGADATIVTTVQSRISLRLSSGASLRLDERTRVTLIEPHRVRLASGAVYVDSGAASSSTLVATPLGDATDVGTRFEVRVDDDALLVRVRDGAVVVRGERERLNARAGEEVEIGRSGGVARREVLPYAATWDWAAEVAPAFTLRGASLGDFLDWMRGELGYGVRFDAGFSEDAASVRLDGSIEGLTPRQALDVVIPSTGLGYRIEGGTLFLYDAAGR